MFDPQKRQIVPSSVAQLVARSAVMIVRSKQPEGFWFEPRLRSMRSFFLVGSQLQRCFSLGQVKQPSVVSKSFHLQC